MASSSSSSQSCNYDVFLSFRGEDTRKTFVDYLYSTLVDRMISTYKDDETLPRGDFIRPSLFKAIEESQIAVIVFSENYADSSWCLEELTHIMKCVDEGKLIVMPIFYCVDPSEVRKLKGKFGEAFNKHEKENNNKAKSWREALIRASEIAGWEPKNVANGHEMKGINKIVDTISDRLFSLTSNVDENLVGMRVRLEELEARLELEMSGVRIVGIWGVGGIGKTTIATSLCLKISPDFQGQCIVDNVRERSKNGGLVTLQQHILKCLLKTDKILGNVIEGKAIIKRMLRRSKVFIVLDDVDHIDQLEALAGSHTWFGSGSRIIITTRNKQLLQSHKVDHVFPVTVLSDEEAFELFCKRAFDGKKPGKDFEALSSRVVEYAARLPLALNILGAFLCGRGIDEWKSTLDRLKNNPQKEIVQTLKISYDGLEHSEKQLFLDIVCFFRRDYYIMETAMEIFEACSYDPVIGIKVLEEKALITFVKNEWGLDGFDMHDLVQEMAHYIVRGDDDPTNPEMHSRVWGKEKIMYLQGETKENDKIEAMECYHDYLIPSVLCKIISRMKKLRYLVVSEPYGVSDRDGGDDGPSFLSNELRYINWYKYSGSQFPDDFQPMKLAHLKLRVSLQKELWKGYKYLPNLKVLHLISMENLLRTPDFGGLPCLQKLKLHRCNEITEVHPSLGNHQNIENVSLSQCRKLRMFPTIAQMRKLKSLEISDCDYSFKFPNTESNMENLERLILGNIAIDALLSSIRERCANLTLLHLSQCYFHSKINEFNFDGLKRLDDFVITGGITYVEKRDDFDLYNSNCLRLCYVTQQLISLQKLCLTYCHLEDGDTPSIIGELFNLQELDLGGNEFTRLHFSLSKLTKLKLLSMSRCKLLVELPELPSGLVTIIAVFCPKLKAIGDVYKNCKLLSRVSLTAGAIINDGSRLLEHILQENASQNRNMVLELGGYEIAKWFRPPLIRGRKCRLQLPENWCNEFAGFLICAVQNYRKDLFTLSVSIEQAMSGTKSKSKEEADVVWEEFEYEDEDEDEDDGKSYTTEVWYVSFASLRYATWWDETYNALLFTMDFFSETRGLGFGVRLVPWKCGSSPTQTSTATSQQNYNYTSLSAPKLKITEDSVTEDSAHRLKFCLI